jgi:hypothetical protein
VTASRWHFNVFVVFLVSGLWHGADWSFVVWGVAQAFYLMAGAATLPIRRRFHSLIGLTRVPRLHAAIQVGWTFFLMCLSFTFFRSGSIKVSWYMLTHIASDWGMLLQPRALLQTLASTGSGYTLIVAVLATAFMFWVHLIQRHETIRDMFGTRPKWFRWTLYYVLIASILLFGEMKAQEFIYFQF